jgi:ATP-dependent Clp protease ATP-binding subunit ClpB
VIIMTSNLGSQYLLEDGVTDRGEIKEEARKAVMREMRSAFRPEFLNRVDDVVLFKPLTIEELEEIVDLQTADLHRRLEEHKIDLELTEAARALVARKGFDPVFGARPLKRYLQHELETRIGRAIVGGEVLEGAKLVVDVENDELAVRIENPAKAEGASGEEAEPMVDAEVVGA